MVYGYTVKKNGILYKPGQDVPDNVLEHKINDSATSLKDEQKHKRGRPPKTEA